MLFLSLSSKKNLLYTKIYKRLKPYLVSTKFKFFFFNHTLINLSNCKKFVITFTEEVFFFHTTLVSYRNTKEFVFFVIVWKVTRGFEPLSLNLQFNTLTSYVT